LEKELNGEKNIGIALGGFLKCGKNKCFKNDLNEEEPFDKLNSKVSSLEAHTNIEVPEEKVIKIS
jgi:hypothetical protein